MSAHTPSTTYAQYIADCAAANATRAGSVSTAQSTLATSLSTAQAAAKPNDGGALVAAISAAYKASDTSVATANAINDAAVIASYNNHKRAAGLPL